MSDDNIYMIKLSNREEIIGEIDDKDNKDHIKIYNPLLVSVERDSTSGQLGMMLIDYIPYSNSDSIDVNVNNIMFISVVNYSMKTYYEKSVYYNMEYHKNKFKNNIEMGISNLDSLIDNYITKKTNRKITMETIEKMILASVNPSSNSIQ